MTDISLFFKLLLEKADNFPSRMGYVLQRVLPGHAAFFESEASWRRQGWVNDTFGALTMRGVGNDGLGAFSYLEYFDFR